MARYFVMTSIPYVNGAPHVGHALELVQADVLARHRRARGDEVRAQTGTDDHALKNVQAAEAAGRSPREYVDDAADRFRRLGDALELSFDDFLATSSDPRHAPGVRTLWEACASNGDLELRTYSGLYCVGCELYYTPDELDDGRCPEHGTIPELVEEQNWFFALSRYEERLAGVIRSGELRVEPPHRRREVLAFIEAGLEDFSASRSVARARGWGIPVPGDPEQVVYVWFDALANYLTGVGYGTDDATFGQWWGSDAETVHVIGKGIIRFHAVYWPAMLMSAGLPLPSTIFVHEYLNADGRKISKSLGNTQDPAEIAAAYGSDALRWWMLRDVARTGDTAYSDERLVARANEDLANNLGNLVNRTVSMVQRYRDGVVSTPAAGKASERQGETEADAALADLRRARDAASAEIDAALADFDFRRAVGAIIDIGDAANRFIESSRPWALARSERADAAPPDALDAVLAELVTTVRVLATHLTPFVPGAAQRIARQAGDGGGRVADPDPVFPRLEFDST